MFSIQDLDPDLKYWFNNIYSFNQHGKPILRFLAGSAFTMECIYVHKYIYSDYIFYRCILHKYIQLNRVVS